MISRRRGSQNTAPAWFQSIIFLLLLSQCAAFIHPAVLHSVRLQQQPLIDTRTSISVDADADGFYWADLTPSAHLNYTPCYTNFQCARLSVPLNWNASTSSNQIFSLAVIRLPARVPPTSPHYGGAILFNPGGPGESGIHQILTGGRYLQTIVDSSVSPSSSALPVHAKYFDLIGFDPRGVKNTTPHLKCFPNGNAQDTWIAGLMDYGVLWGSEEAVGLEWARAEALGRSCAAAGGDGEEAAIRYVNTAQVVEDVREIVERHGEWRAGEVESLLAEGELSYLSEEEREAERERAAWKRGKEMLQYWGQSYGSILGQTFAAMYPERVGRVVVDGVVSPEDYYGGTWLANLVDSDKVMTKFAEYCFEAGPERCPLYTDTSAADIEQWMTEFVFGLATNPLAVGGIGSGPLGPEVITFGDIVLRIIAAMHFPTSQAEKYFQLLSDISHGNTSALVAEKQARQSSGKLSSRCRKDGPYSDACISDSYFGLQGGTQSIECMDSDGGAGRNLTKDGFKSYYHKLNQQSKWYVSTWARHRMSCVGIEDVHPAWTFDGPIAGNTSHPLLVIGNSYDTVTPIQNARHATELFPGAALIHQDSEGHCSYSNPSVCTGRLIRQYFQTGSVPKNGTICEPEYRPWIGCVHKDRLGRCRKRSADDKALWNAWLNLTKIWP